MSVEKVAITLDETLLQRVDRLVKKAVFPSRSRAIQEAVAEKLERLEHSRLARECAKLSPQEERRLADLGIGAEVSGSPAYHQEGHHVLHP
ncbi:MAG: ribbon-helix-helix protein, CopG family [Verrucomicrobia bacterium]|nr:ribbon-helix-helix protein, CopG family [Verrucomicrobiota bacterium]